MHFIMKYRYTDQILKLYIETKSYFSSHDWSIVSTLRVSCWVSHGNWIERTLRTASHWAKKEHVALGMDTEENKFRLECDKIFRPTRLSFVTSGEAKKMATSISTLGQKWRQESTQTGSHSAWIFHADWIKIRPASHNGAPLQQLAARAGVLYYIPFFYAAPAVSVREKRTERERERGRREIF